MNRMNLAGGNPHNKRWQATLMIVVCLTILGGAMIGLSMHRSAKTFAVISEIEPGTHQQANPIDLSHQTTPAIDGQCVLFVGRVQVTPHGLFFLHDKPIIAGCGPGDEASQTPLSLFLAERGFVAVQMMRLHAQSAEAIQQAKDARNFASAFVEQALSQETFIASDDHGLRLDLIEYRG